MNTQPEQSVEISDNEMQAIKLGQPVIRLKTDDPLIAIVSGDNTAMRADAIYQLVQKSYAEKQDHTWVGQRGNVVHSEDLTMLEVLRCCSIAAAHMFQFQTNEAIEGHVPVYTVDHVIDMPAMTNMEVNAHEMAILVCYLLESLLKGKKEAKNFEQDFQLTKTSEDKAAEAQTNHGFVVGSTRSNSCYISPNSLWAVYLPDDVAFSIGETVGLRDSDQTVVVEEFAIDQANDDVIVQTSGGEFSIRKLLKIGVPDTGDTGTTEEPEEPEDIIGATSIILRDCGHDMTKFFQIAKSVCAFSLQHKTRLSDSSDNIIVGGFSCQNHIFDLASNLDAAVDFLLYKPQQESTVEALSAVIRTGYHYYGTLSTPDGVYIVIYEPGLALLVDSFVYGVESSNYTAEDVPEIVFNKEFDHEILRKIVLEPMKPEFTSMQVPEDLPVEKDVVEEPESTATRPMVDPRDVAKAMELILLDCEYDAVKFLDVVKGVSLIQYEGMVFIDHSAACVIPGGYACNDFFLQHETNADAMVDFVLYKLQHALHRIGLEMLLRTSGDSYYGILDTPDGPYAVIYEQGFAILKVMIQISGVQGPDVDRTFQFNKEFDRKLVKKLVIESKGKPQSVGDTSQPVPLVQLVEKDEPTGPQCSGCPENTSGA